MSQRHFAAPADLAEMRLADVPLRETVELVRIDLPPELMEPRISESMTLAVAARSTDDCAGGKRGSSITPRPFTRKSADVPEGKNGTSVRMVTA